VTWIRIAFVVATLAGFSGVLAYIILWIAVPARPYVPGAFYPRGSRYNADYRVYEDKAPPVSDSSYTIPEPQPLGRTSRSQNGRMIAGLILVGFGAFFLLDEFNVIPYWFDFGKLWPLIFIIPGILIISKNGRKRNYEKTEGMRNDNIVDDTTSSTTTGTTTSSADTSSAAASGSVSQEEEPKL
jgi:phage shock protein C